MASTGEVRRLGRGPNRTSTAGVAFVVALVLLATTGVTTSTRPSNAYLWFGELDIAAAPNIVTVDGLPKVRYGSGLQTNPLTITQWGLEQHAQRHDAAALRAADWLVENQHEDGTWTYDFAYENASVGVDLRSGWISALTQGQTLSLLVRAWRMTGDIAYLDTGRAALRPFEVPVADGGVLREWHGHPFYEEYPTTRPTYVLNGFLFALVGLREFANATRDPVAQRLWEDGESSAAVMMTRYSAGEHDSTYDLATPHIVRGSGYAKIHVDLAREMYRLTGRAVYREASDRWAPAI